MTNQKYENSLLHIFWRNRIASTSTEINILPPSGGLRGTLQLICLHFICFTFPDTSHTTSVVSIFVSCDFFFPHFSTLASDLLKLCGESRPRNKVACTNPTPPYPRYLANSVCLFQCSISSHSVPSGTQANCHPNGASVRQQQRSVLRIPNDGRLVWPSAGPGGGSSQRFGSNRWPQTDYLPVYANSHTGCGVSISRQLFYEFDDEVFTLVLCSSGCKSPTGSNRRLPECSPLCQRKAQEKSTDINPALSPLLARSPPQGAMESAPRGGNYKSMWVPPQCTGSTSHFFLYVWQLKPHIVEASFCLLDATKILCDEPNILNFDSSVHNNIFQSSVVQWQCFLVQGSLFAFTS